MIPTSAFGEKQEECATNEKAGGRAKETYFTHSFGCVLFTVIYCRPGHKGLRKIYEKPPQPRSTSERIALFRSLQRRKQRHDKQKGALFKTRLFHELAVRYLIRYDLTCESTSNQFIRFNVEINPINYVNDSGGCARRV